MADESGEGPLTPEEAFQRTREGIRRGGLKDYTQRPESPRLVPPVTETQTPVRPRSISPQGLRQGIEKTALVQSLEQGQRTRTEERLRQVTSPRPETPGKKLDRVTRGEVRNE
ncbi:hypothetical protein A2V56_03995 [Candidatus Woesebacteria bacterium RBG_19FT_COMBO_42_9]|uniref:Uncharacterized protein n=1 Tax=Candidatus Woesebacteria bacterium RBG_16_42_24 TaxID=1802485 RepID=A0A1F7XJS0_9BACT|nr:MAG: hypothetical protein A2V97_01370 [Candidatus Woesebacteria bacterium RBG_16_42_24]OGM17784.1 MAG: hypothetical protein A2V56_03995 [Candidatus Woesebacteria bacterium RBG_19FT_COMBO_42_9]OGM67649.1 MAG: hypothetical protein A2985_00640 [Candidatus Woesebacteria bacterium RIFCSPLOWO2_01_FULL_43_11]